MSKNALGHLKYLNLITYGHTGHNGARGITGQLKNNKFINMSIKKLQELRAEPYTIGKNGSFSVRIGIFEVSARTVGPRRNALIRSTKT